MKIFSWKLFLAGILNLICFIGIFVLLQRADIYESTLGKFSSNYTRIETGDQYEIRKVKKAYEKFKEQKFKTWDADIYSCIRKNMYSIESGCYTKVKGAFFPLFPMIWKLSNLNSIGISLFNYLLFILSITLLVGIISRKSSQEKLLTYCLLISLPSTVIFYIPYTEALFLFTMTIALIGFLQNRYWLYFLACFAMAMIRPAALFVLLAIMAVETISFLANRKNHPLIRNLICRGLPFVTGFVMAILIQYASSNSFSTMLDAQSYWQGSFSGFSQISDWSVEGFGLNTFAVFFIALPALCFIFYTIIRRKEFFTFYNNAIEDPKESTKYFFLISIYYLAGILLFILLTSGGNLHSFFRFTMASPPFYIALLFLLSSLQGKSIKTASLLFIIPLLMLSLFLMNTGFGGNHTGFEYTGMYLSILTFAFLYYRHYISVKMQWILAGILIFCSMVWNTYLLNVFLSDGWIFT